MSTRKLATLIAAKHDVLVQIQSVLREQSQIEADVNLTLNEVFAHQKMVLVDELLALEKQLAPFHEVEPGDRVWESPAAREQCREVEQRCCAMLKEILAQERQAEAELIERRKDTAHQLQQSRIAAQARNAYRNAQQPRQSGLNLSSE